MLIMVKILTVECDFKGWLRQGWKRQPYEAKQKML